jgi:hypothetical protein
MRTRTSILVAAATTAVFAGDVAPATALSERSAAAKAVSARMLAAPRPEALVTRLPVRVVVRVPAEAGRLWVRVGGRNVSARFRRTRGSRSVAYLRRSDGLRYGPNHISVLAERRGGRPVADARSLVLARRQDGLVRLRVRTGPVTSLHVRVAGGAGLAPEHFGQPGEVERRLSVIRRKRMVRVWLNGRRVTRALDRSRPTRWTATLSASHGLRYGVNRLRMLVAEPDRGRYAVVRRRFVVRRERHLPAAGWDVATRVGERVRLDGRRSRATGGGPLDHSWKVLSKPRGSRAVLRRAGGARPLLAANRPGKYVVGLTVTRRATGSRLTRSSTDRVEATVGPASLLVPFKGLTARGDTWGIQVGDTFYPNPSPGGPGKYAMQWLTLDRATLQPIKTGNSWFDGSGSGDHGLGALTSALSDGGLDQVVILSFPRFGSAGPAVQADQVDGFNRAMKTIGVGPIDAGLLTAQGQKLVVMGVPYGGGGSGWYTHGGGGMPDALTGSLMPDATLDGSGAFQFRLQPERPEFDTSLNGTPTTNTIRLRNLKVDGKLPAGAAGGFHVAVIDPIDFTFGESATFATNGVADPVSGLQAMAKFLGDNAPYGVAVQSIGRVVPPSLPGNPTQPSPDWSAWKNVATVLSGFGANPHTFNTVDGSYAFVGGRQLAKSEVAESSSAVVIDPASTPPKRESGTLRGRAGMRGDGYFMPVVEHGPESLESSLHDIVFGSPQPWPYTKGGIFPQQANCPAPGNDTAAYAAALSYIAAGIDLSSYQSDLRTAYFKRGLKTTWSDQKTDLAGLQFESKRGFGKAEFCNLKAELQREFDWLDDVKGLFDSYEAALNRSGATQSVNLQAIGENVLKLVAPQERENAEVEWSIGGFLEKTILAVEPEAEAVLAAWEGLVTSYELAKHLSSDTAGPVGDKVESKVNDLAREAANHVFDTANALDRLRQVINSDYGRLNALGPAANTPRWAIDSTDMGIRLTTATNAFFSSELLPVASDVWYLHHGTTTQQGDVTADTCWMQGYGWPFEGATAKLQWNADFAGADNRENTHLWVLASPRGNDPVRAPKIRLPPADLTDPMFRPASRKGYGVQLARFMWSEYEPPPAFAACARLVPDRP